MSDSLYPGRDLQFRCEVRPVAYAAALAEMTDRNAAVQQGQAPELIWCLEHPSLYTAGTSAAPGELLDSRFEVVQTGRGGRYTYHGPGQRIVYTVIDLGRRARDVRCFVHALEGWIIATLADFGVPAWRSAAGVGIWVTGPDGREAKIGAIGVRIRRWVTMHGASINLSPDLSHYAGIVPCGIADAGVTSLAALGLRVTAAEWDAALLARADDFLSTLGATSGRAAA